MPATEARQRLRPRPRTPEYGDGCTFAVYGDRQRRFGSVAARWPMCRFPPRGVASAGGLRVRFDRLARRAGRARAPPVIVQNVPCSSQKVPCSSKPCFPGAAVGRPPQSVSALRRGAGGARSAPDLSPVRNRVKIVGEGRLLFYICSRSERRTMTFLRMLWRAPPARSTRLAVMGPAYRSLVVPAPPNHDLRNRNIFFPIGGTTLSFSVSSHTGSDVRPFRGALAALCPVQPLDRGVTSGAPGEGRAGNARSACKWRRKRLKRLNSSPEMTPPPASGSQRRDGAGMIDKPARSPRMRVVGSYESPCNLL